jgi:hydroxyethylthiazole kinase-like uncharacterized protein yjeF
VAHYIFDRMSSRAVDREAMVRYGMPTILLMENAAIALRGQALRMLTGVPAEPTRRGEPILIICGSGNNGGDGYALARHLHNHGCSLEILALGAPREGTDARINYDICAKMNLSITSGRQNLRVQAREADVIVDAIFGTGLDRPVEGESREVIEWINAAGRPVLAADIPSGLDCDTGLPLGAAVHATRTVSFLGLKKGFTANTDSRRYTGDVVVGDIGVPRELLEEFGARL